MGTLWGKGKLGIGRDGTGEEGNRCLVRQKCETLFLLALSLNQQHPWKALSKTRAGAMRQAAQGPKTESAQPNQGCRRSPMYSGFPELALILVVSVAPWNRSIGTQPPEPKAGSRTQLGALPLGYPPHRSWS